MARKTTQEKPNSQSKKFIDKARELGVDESIDPLDSILKRVTKPKKKLKTDKAPDE